MEIFGRLFEINSQKNKVGHSSGFLRDWVAITALLWLKSSVDRRRRAISSSALKCLNWEGSNSVARSTPPAAGLPLWAIIIGEGVHHQVTQLPAGALPRVTRARVGLDFIMPESSVFCFFRGENVLREGETSISVEGHLTWMHERTSNMSI